jgi:anti-sigma factor RsiW
MTFIGGRLFFVNGWPVGQIAYHDRDGRLFGFCLKRNPTGTEQPLTERQIDDLYLIDWQDPEYQYVLIGFVDSAEIKPLAERLSRTYRDET